MRNTQNIVNFIILLAFKLMIWYRLKVMRYTDNIPAVDKLDWISENAKKYKYSTHKERLPKSLCPEVLYIFVPFIL